MAKSTDSSIKLLLLYDILSKMTDEKHALSTQEIINELIKRGVSVSRKVLPSDIALLNKYGYEVLSYTKKSRYYYVVQRSFDTAEIVMLADMIQASKLTKKKKGSLTDKLYSTIGMYRDGRTSDSCIFLEPTKCGNPSIIYNIDAIERAIREKKKVSFLYFSLDENKNKVYHCDKKRYLFNPLSMIWCKDNYYLLCYDDVHSGISRYRIDKMEEVQTEKEDRFEKEEFRNFNSEIYRKQIFSMFGGELKKVEIRFVRELLDVIYDKFGTDIRIEKIDEDLFQANVEVQVSRTFFIWMIGTMGKVKIKAPLTVKKQFDEFVQKIKECYQDI